MFSCSYVNLQEKKMISVGGFGIGSSVVLSVLVFALVAELFYFLWWKRKIAELEVDDGDGGKCGSKIFRLLRWKNSSSFSTSRTLNYSNESDLEQGIYSNDSQAKIVDEESVESELKRVHNLTGPPRFLFAIEEETKEDMAEAEDGKSRWERRRRKGSRSRSLRDALMAVEPPVLTPLSSSPLKVSPLNPLELYELHSLNPLFETHSEPYSFKSSPPPTFKFLRDAEDKFFKKLIEGSRKSSAAESSTMIS